MNIVNKTLERIKQAIYDSAEVVLEAGGLSGKIFLSIKSKKGTPAYTNIIAIYGTTFVIGILFTMLVFMWSPLLALLLSMAGHYITHMQQAITYAASEEGQKYKESLEAKKE